MAGGGDEKVRRELAKAGELATTRAAIVRAHERRVAEAEAAVADAEAAIAAARERGRQEAVDETTAEARRLGEELDRGVTLLADKARSLLGTGARLVELMGDDQGWDCRLTLLSPSALGKQLAKAVAWHVAPPDGRPLSDLGMAYSDPERLSVLVPRGLENWFPVAAPSAPEPAAPPPGYLSAPPPSPEVISAALSATFGDVGRATTADRGGRRRREALLTENSPMPLESINLECWRFRGSVDGMPPWLSAPGARRLEGDATEHPVRRPGGRCTASRYCASLRAR